MRRFHLLLWLAAVLACGPIDQEGGTPQIIPPEGGAADAGAGAGDAGAGSGGSGGGGVDAGTGGGVGSAPSSCDGVLPSDFGAAVTVTTPHGSNDVCFNASVDLAGNVAAESHAGSMGSRWTGRWQVWSPTGAARGSFSGVGGDVFGEPDGFQTTQRAAHVFFSPDGRVLRRSELDDSCGATAFYSATGGSLVVQTCGRGKLKVHRFDAQGVRAASAEIAGDAPAAGLVDFAGRILIVAAQGGSLAGRWYDSALSPVSGSFKVPGSSASAPALRPLIGGGGAIQIDGAWVAIVRSGVTSAEQPPQWLASHRDHDLEIVRQGRAYALVPKSGAPARDTLLLHSSDGQQCGGLKFPVRGLGVGKEGTVVGTSGDGGCTHPFWSGLLR